MGLGNQNTEGNKKSNFRWQYAMLKALDKIYQATSGTPPFVENKQAVTQRETASGLQTTVGNLYAISFFNASAVKAAIVGTDLLPGESISFSAEGQGLLSAIDFDPDTTGANAGDLLISMVVEL